MVATWLSAMPLGGMGVPGMPRTMMRINSSSVVPRRNLPWLKSMPATPLPSGPWQPVQFARYRRPPASISAGRKRCCAATGDAHNIKLTNTLTRMRASYARPRPSRYVARGVYASGPGHGLRARSAKRLRERPEAVTRAKPVESPDMPLILHGLSPIHWAAAGAVIAVITLLLLFLANKRLGLSTGFEDVCSLVTSMPYFQRKAVVSGRGWRLPFLAGLLLGGFLSAALAG